MNASQTMYVPACGKSGRRGLRGNFIVVKAACTVRRVTGPETQTIWNNNGPEMETMSVWSRPSRFAEYLRTRNIWGAHRPPSVTNLNLTARVSRVRRIPEPLNVRAIKRARGKSQEPTATRYWIGQLSCVTVARNDDEIAYGSVEKRYINRFEK